MRIFASNLKKFKVHNSEAAKGLYSYTMGVNQFADLTDLTFISRDSGRSPIEQ